MTGHWTGLHYSKPLNTAVLLLLFIFNFWIFTEFNNSLFFWFSLSSFLSKWKVKIGKSHRAESARLGWRTTQTHVPGQDRLKHSHDHDSHYFNLLIISTFTTVEIQLNMHGHRNLTSILPLQPIGYSHVSDKTDCQRHGNLTSSRKSLTQCPSNLKTDNPSKYPLQKSTQIITNHRYKLLDSDTWTR